MDVFLDEAKLANFEPSGGFVPDLGNKAERNAVLDRLAITGSYSRWAVCGIRFASALNTEFARSVA